MFTMWLLICKSKSEIFMIGRLLASPLRLRWLPREAWAQQGFRHLASRSGFHDLDFTEMTSQADRANLCCRWSESLLGLGFSSSWPPPSFLSLPPASFAANAGLQTSFFFFFCTKYLFSFYFCSAKPIFSKSSKLDLLWSRMSVAEMVLLPKDWKLVELGKALLILPLTWVFRKLDLCSGGIAGFRGSAGAR